MKKYTIYLKYDEYVPTEKDKKSEIKTKNKTLIDRARADFISGIDKFIKSKDIVILGNSELSYDMNLSRDKIFEIIDLLRSMYCVEIIDPEYESFK